MSRLRPGAISGGTGWRALAARQIWVYENPAPRLGARNHPTEGQMTIVRAAAVLIAAMILPTAIAAAQEAAEKPPAAPSKLGVFVLGGPSKGTYQLVEAGLPMMRTNKGQLKPGKFFQHYYEHCPQGIAILGMVRPGYKQDKDDPIECAQKHWDEDIKPVLSALTDEQRKWIDYVECGPNMWGFEKLERVHWMARYWGHLGQLIHDAGFRPVVATIGVGSPGGNAQEIEEKVRAYIPLLRKAKEWNAAWAYHAYTIKYTTDPEIESWYSLRYRRMYKVFREEAPDLMDFPLLLSEAGCDEVGDPKKSGWAARGTAEDYQRWLTWFDNEIKRDPYVVGCCLFQIGSTGWKSFDLEPMVPWLVEHLRQSGKPPAPRSVRP